MTPIIRGTATRLGLRKPTGAYVFRDGSIRDEIRLMPMFDVAMHEDGIRRNVKAFADACGVSLQDWQVDWMARNTPPIRR